MPVRHVMGSWWRGREKEKNGNVPHWVGKKPWTLRRRCDDFGLPRMEATLSIVQRQLEEKNREKREFSLIKTRGSHPHHLHMVVVVAWCLA